MTHKVCKKGEAGELDWSAIGLRNLYSLIPCFLSLHFSPHSSFSKQSIDAPRLLAVSQEALAG